MALVLQRRGDVLLPVVGTSLLVLWGTTRLAARVGA